MLLCLISIKSFYLGVNVIIDLEIKHHTKYISFISNCLIYIVIAPNREWCIVYGWVNGIICNSKGLCLKRTCGMLLFVC